MRTPAFLLSCFALVACGGAGGEPAATTGGSTTSATTTSTTTTTTTPIEQAPPDVTAPTVTAKPGRYDVVRGSQAIGVDASDDVGVTRVELSVDGTKVGESPEAPFAVAWDSTAAEDGIRAQATLKKLFDKRQQELDGKQTELGRAREDIEKQSRVLSREALQKRMEDWQRRMIELQTVFVDYNKELQKKQGELTGPILKKMMTVIGRVAKKSGYELILDRQAAPYARPDLDLTEQVVQMYNSGDAGDSSGGDEKKEAK